MATTIYMNLTLPTVSSTIGPEWAAQLNTAITLVDSHDHSSGKGTQIPSAGININANLSFNNYNLTDTGAVTFNNLTTTLSTLNTTYVKDGDLYFNDASGASIRLTASGAINVSSVGAIGGDYATTAATVYYTDSTKKYTFEDSAAANAEIVVGNVECGAITASGTVQVGGATTISGTTTLNGTTTVAATTIVSGDANFTGNTTGRGILPVGAILPLMANLTGITDVTATTAADANGFVVCGGQTISDASSPLNGQVIPNINNSVFLMGHGTAGSTGGANSLTLSEAQLPSHAHDISHTHADTFALGSATVAAASHTHNMKHTHIHSFYDDSGDDYYTLVASDNTSTSITTGDSIYIRAATATSAGGSFNIIQDALDGGGDKSLYTTGAIDGNSGTGADALTGVDDGSTTTVTITGAVTSMTGNSGNTGSGSSVDNKPNYLTAKYIMRIE